MADTIRVVIDDSHVKSGGYRPTEVLINPKDSEGYRDEGEVVNPLTGTVRIKPNGDRDSVDHERPGR